MLAAMRTIARAALAVALVGAVVACAAGEETTRLGFVIAPSAPADPSSEPGPEARDAGPGTYRALPPEPTGANCKVLCRGEDDDVPRAAFPPPFERCSDEYGKADPGARFSANETRKERVLDPVACCYVDPRSCRRRVL